MLAPPNAHFFITPRFHRANAQGQAVIDPATLEHVGTRAEVSCAEIETALAEVTAAQAQWKAIDAKSRARVLHALAHRIETTDLSSCAILMSREMGKPYPEEIGELANCALVESEQTHAVAFTGSVAAARAVAAAAAQRMKPAVIEAGGSDPMIISAHAPLDVAAAGAVTGAFHMSGQVCTSTKRIYVVDAVHDAFVSTFAAQTARLRIGNGHETSEIGPLVSEAARAKVMRLVGDAVAKGARVVCGGRIPPGQLVGWFFEPTILTGCTAEMDLLHEECFGPVAAIIRVPDFEAAIAAANDSDFGLGALVFTTALDEAHEAHERREAGMVWINNPMIDNDALPFGGWKNSGLGRELGRMGLDSFRRSKMVLLDHKPARQDWYPYPDAWFLAAGGRKPG